MGKDQLIYRLRLLPIVFALSVVGYFLTNFEVFRFSRGLFGAVLFLIMASFFLLGIIAIIGVVIKLLRKKPSSTFLYDASACFVYILLFYFFISPMLPQRLPEGSYSMAFDQKIWKADDAAAFKENDITPRQKMVADVIKNVLPNRSREEIIEILGPPTETDKWENMKRNHLIYVLGPERGYLAIDYEWLFISLEDNKFKSAGLGTD